MPSLIRSDTHVPVSAFRTCAPRYEEAASRSIGVVSTARKLRQQILVELDAIAERTECCRVQYRPVASFSWGQTLFYGWLAMLAVGCIMALQWGYRKWQVQRWRR